MTDMSTYIIIESSLGFLCFPISKVHYDLDQKLTREMYMKVSVNQIDMTKAIY